MVGALRIQISMARSKRRNECITRRVISRCFGLVGRVGSECEIRSIELGLSGVNYLLIHDQSSESS